PRPTSFPYTTLFRSRAQIPYRLRERSEPDLRRRVIALRSATGFRPTKVLVANQHSGRDTRSTALGAKRVCRQPRHPTPRTSWTRSEEHTSELQSREN